MVWWFFGVSTQIEYSFIIFLKTWKKYRRKDILPTTCYVSPTLEEELSLSKKSCFVIQGTEWAIEETLHAIFFFFFRNSVAEILLYKWHFENFRGSDSKGRGTVCQSVGASQLSTRFLTPMTDLREGLTDCTGDGSKESTEWTCHTLPYMSLYASAIISRCELQRCVRMSINTSFSQPERETWHRL